MPPPGYDVSRENKGAPHEMKKQGWPEEGPQAFYRSALGDILLKPIERNARTEIYQRAIDDFIDRAMPGWDIDRGLLGTRGIVLPHEKVKDFWELPVEEQRRAADPAEWNAYDASLGRRGTASLALAAFAWHSPISRHHGNPELLRFFQNGLKTFADSVRSDGIMNMGAHDSGKGMIRSAETSRYTWSFGWVAGPLICGLYWCRDALDKSILRRALQKLKLAAESFAAIGRDGDLGNQACVQVHGLYCFADLLGNDACRRAADLYWSEIWDKILDSSGQVIENAGPCMHYSYTAFFYAWLNVFLRRQKDEMDRIEKALLWFRYRHTESLFPMAGPSARKYYETLHSVAVDLLPMCEQAAGKNPVFQEFADRIMALSLPAHDGHLESLGKFSYSPTRLGQCVPGHGASPFIWAILASPGPKKPSKAQRMEWAEPFAEEYRRIAATGRPGGEVNYSPLRYALVRRKYQTHFNSTDYLPFCGLQTWAWGDEPPIIHPTLYCPSTTRGFGLDTAQQGTGRAWMDIDNPMRGGMLPEHLAQQSGNGLYFIVARFGRLYRLIVFTEFSTVQVDFGRTGPRKTSWTLNRLVPGSVTIGRGMVSLGNLEGRIYSSVPKPPALKELGPGRWTKGVRILEYDDGAGPVMFAFSDRSFSFITAVPGKNRALKFADAAGIYKVIIPDSLPLRGEFEYARGGLFDLGLEIRVEKTG